MNGLGFACYAWARAVRLIEPEMYGLCGLAYKRAHVFLVWRACAYLPPHRNFYILNPTE